MAILSDAEMAQLFHSIDLAYYSATNASGKQQAQQAGGYAEDLLAQNMVANAPKTRVGEVLIHGVPIPREAVFSVAKANIQHFRAKDEHFKSSEISDFLRKEELKRINQRSNQIINESHNAGDARAVNYFAHTANKSTGVNSSRQNLPNQISYRHPSIARQELVRSRLLTESKSAPIARQMIDKLNTQQARMQAPTPEWSGMQHAAGRS